MIEAKAVCADQHWKTYSNTYIFYKPIFQGVDKSVWKVRSWPQVSWVKFIRIDSYQLFWLGHSSMFYVSVVCSERLIWLDSSFSWSMIRTYFRPWVFRIVLSFCLGVLYRFRWFKGSIFGDLWGCIQVILVSFITPHFFFYFQYSMRKSWSACQEVQQFCFTMLQGLHFIAGSRISFWVYFG